MERCNCCKRNIVWQTEGKWDCWYCDRSNSTNWRCPTCHGASSSASKSPQNNRTKIDTTKLPLSGAPGTNYERTFIAVKPDGTDRTKVGNIIARFESKGFKLVGLKMLTPTKEQAAGHYADLKSKPFFNGLVSYFSSGPVTAMVWEGLNVINQGRVLLGETNPKDSLPGSIRGDLCVDIGRNICHGSDGPSSAQHEIQFWFSKDEVQQYTSQSHEWIYEKGAP